MDPPVSVACQCRGDRTHPVFFFFCIVASDPNALSPCLHSGHLIYRAVPSAPYCCFFYYLLLYIFYLFFVCPCVPTCLHEFIFTVCVQITKEAQDVEFPGTNVTGSVILLIWVLKTEPSPFQAQ